MINKICFYTSGFSPNKNAMLSYLEKLLPKNVEAFLFTSKKDKDKYKIKKIKRVDTKCEKYNSFLELRKFCKKENISRIMNLGLLPYEALVMLFSTKFTKTDFVCFHLGNPIDSLKIGSLQSRLRALLENCVSYLLTIFSAKIFFCSSQITNVCKKYLCFAKKKVFYLPPTIPTSFFKPLNKKKIRKKLGFDPNDKIVIFVGRIGFLKGSDILLNLIKTNPDKKFLMIGTLLDQEYKSQNLDNLLLISQKSPQELVDYYNSADLCLFPTRLEGLPLVPREAMSCGVPTLVSDIPSTKFLKKAIRVKLNPEKMNQELNKFFNLPEKRKKQFSKESRKFIIEEFNDEIWKKEYLDKILN